MQKVDIKPYVKDGKMAVLISPGFGSGWSTWNYPEMAWDSRVIEWFLRENEQPDANEAITFLKSIGYQYVYIGSGFKYLQIQWVPLNSFWRITEYDGAENIEFFNNGEGWNCFAGNY